MIGRAALTTACAVAVGSALPASTAAQSRPLFPEARVDGVTARGNAVYGSVGIALPLTTYTRVALTGGAGRSWYRDREGVAARIELVGRFVLDPLRERRWAPYGFAGLGSSYDDLYEESRDRWREVIVLGIGAEGPRVGAVSPAVEVAMGGGTRLSLVLRRALANRR